MIYPFRRRREIEAFAFAVDVAEHRAKEHPDDQYTLRVKYF